MSYSSIDAKLDAEMNEHIASQLREMVLQGRPLPDEEEMELLLHQQLVQRGPSRARITAIEDDDDEPDGVEAADVDDEDEEEDEERTFTEQLWHQWRESGAEAWAKKGYQHATRYAMRAKVFAFSSAWWLTTTTIVVGIPLWYAVQNQHQVGDMIRMESELANIKAQAPGRGMGAPVGAPGTIPPLGTTAGSGIPLA